MFPKQEAARREGGRGWSRDSSTSSGVCRIMARVAQGRRHGLVRRVVNRGRDGGGTLERSVEDEIPIPFESHNPHGS